MNPSRTADNKGGGPSLVKGIILENANVAPSYYKMKVHTLIPYGDIHPGQFVMVKVSEGFSPLLRRPFSIHSLWKQSDKNGTDIEILYKIVGEGTNLMARWREGRELDILGPLGRGFSLSAVGGNPVLVGGGIGVAGLFALGQKLRDLGLTISVLIGGKTKEHVLCIENFHALGAEVHAATEDGSLGFHGMVTDMLKFFFRNRANPSAIFACGPLEMMRVIADITETQSIPCQVSLESRMACGLGACLGCVIPTRGNIFRKPLGATRHENGTSFQRVCKEGPVFNAQEVNWERI